MDTNENLLEREREKYRIAYENPHYRVNNQGFLLWQNFRGIFPKSPRSALDIGCGDGRLFAQMNAEGIDAWGVDFVDVLGQAAQPVRHKFLQANLWDLGRDFAARPWRFELGICADVMEHIPEEKVDAVLSQIAPLCELVVFEIANYPSGFQNPIGPLHCTLHDSDWWHAKLSETGRTMLLEQSRPNVEEYLFFWRPFE